MECPETQAVSDSPVTTVWLDSTAQPEIEDLTADQASTELRELQELAAETERAATLLEETEEMLAETELEENQGLMVSQDQMDDPELTAQLEFQDEREH